MSKLIRTEGNFRILNLPIEVESKRQVMHDYYYMVIKEKQPFIVRGVCVFDGNDDWRTFTGISFEEACIEFEKHLQNSKPRPAYAILACALWEDEVKRFSIQQVIYVERLKIFWSDSYALEKETGFLRKGGGGLNWENSGILMENK